MDIFIGICAGLAVTLSCANSLLMPLFFGQERTPYSYSTWVASLLETALILVIVLRVIGYI